MKVALEILYGNECYHWDSVPENLPDCDLWIEALNAKYFDKGKPYTRKEWDALLGHVSAVTDIPANDFGPELIEAYPEAKVILVEREIDSWFRSWDDIFLKPSASPMLPFITLLDPGGIGKMQDIVTRRIGPGSWNSRNPQELRDNARTYYRAHYARIRAAAPKERLLEHKLGDGWEPLCEFLGVPVPDVPFPRVNERQEGEERVRILIFEGAKRNLRNASRKALPYLVVLAIALLSYGILRMNS